MGVERDTVALFFFNSYLTFLSTHYDYFYGWDRKDKKERDVKCDKEQTRFKPRKWLLWSVMLPGHLSQQLIPNVSAFIGKNQEHNCFQTEEIL